MMTIWADVKPIGLSTIPRLQWYVIASCNGISITTILLFHFSLLNPVYEYRYENTHSCNKKDLAEQSSCWKANYYCESDLINVPANETSIK